MTRQSYHPDPTLRLPGRDKLLELARQWAADADAVDADIDKTEDVDVALEFSGKVDALRSCATQLTRLLRAEEQPTEP